MCRFNIWLIMMWEGEKISRSTFEIEDEWMTKNFDKLKSLSAKFDKTKFLNLLIPKAIIRSDYEQFLTEADFKEIDKKMESKEKEVKECLDKYKELNDPKPKFLPFLLGYLWYNSLDDKNDYLSVVDFSMGDNSQRLYLINMKSNKVEVNTTCMQWEWKKWVQTFSNESWSWQSSIGLAVVPMYYKDWNARSYHPERGKWDENLLLRWTEPGFNDNIFDRKIYMHTWNRSQWCFTLPQTDIWHEVIRKMASWGTIMSFYPDANYLKNTRLLEIS